MRRRLNNNISFGSSKDTEIQLKEGKVTAYEALKFLCGKAEKSRLENEFWNDGNVRLSIDTIQKILPLNDKQVILFVMFSAYTLGNCTASMTDIGSKLDINPFTLFELDNDLEELIDKGYISPKSENFTGAIEYEADKSILKSLRDGKKVHIKQQDKIKNNIDFIRYIFKNIISQRLTNNLREKQIERLFKNNKHLGFVQQLEKRDFTNMEIQIIIYLLEYLIQETCNVNYSKMLEDLSDNDMTDVYNLKSYLQSKESTLIKIKFIEIFKGNFMQEDMVHISKKAVSALLPKEKNIIIPHKGKADEPDVCTIIKPKDITKKDLIYDTETEKQICTLRDILSQEGLHNLQKNLKNNGLRQGINVLLYGCPGMGKTETVLQLCRENKRAVLQVNISDMKSQWFGQSEKIVSNLFEEYNNLMKNSKNTPVLLFNEADGVLSKRHNLSGNSSCGQTENTIQNIILQAFENNKGIIICTTNMVKNLDAAFERRFLYKIEFCEPDLPTRTALVKLKLGMYLSEKEAMNIASECSLTGGMLDNILTKIIAKKCLYNTTPNFHEIEEYCQQDMMGKKKYHPIGFGQYSE